MTNGILPASCGLVPVVGVICSNEIVDPVQIELSIWCVDDSLRYHLGIAELRFDVPVVILAEVHIVGT